MASTIHSSAATPAAARAVLVFRPMGFSGYRHSADGTIPASGCLLSVHAAALAAELLAAAAAMGG